MTTTSPVKAPLLVIAPFALVRAPLFPCDRADALFAKDLDRQHARERLAEFIDDDPRVREALWLASPSLSLRIETWRANLQAVEGSSTLLKIEQALVRYVHRMTGRATPFGLFAGVTFARISESASRRQTSLRLTDTTRRCVRLDAEAFTALAASVPKETLRYWPHSARVVLDGRLQFPEAASGAYRVSSLGMTEALEVALDRAASGATREELVEVIVDLGAQEEAAGGFVDKLIASGCLESSLVPALTGDDDQRLADWPTVQSAIERIHGTSLAEPASYREVIAQVEAAANADAGGGVKQCLRVDMLRDGECTLSTSDGELIAEGCRALWLLSEDASSGSSPLDSFRKAFATRYGTRSVPLSEALDDDFGVGFAHAQPRPAPLLDDLDFERDESPEPAASSRSSLLLLRKVEAAWAVGAEEIEITSRDLEELSAMEERAPMPLSIAAFVSLVDHRDDHGSAPRLMLHHWTDSATRLLGRFASWDRELTSELRAHTRCEEKLAGGDDEENLIFAEVVHVPANPRGINVAQHPSLYRYEIPICARPGAPSENVIALDDLLVSVADNEVRLVSKRLGKRVIPKFSTSLVHRPGMSVAACQFMRELTVQGQTPMGKIHWGPLAAAKSLPRVVMVTDRGERLVLSPRRWLLDQAELASLACSAPGERLAAMARLCERLDLPRVVGLVDGDNILPVHVASSLSVDAFASVLHGREGAMLIELLGHDGAPGSFVNEIVVPFLCPRPLPVERPRRQHSAIESRAVQRSFPPGSEWLYAKIYGGEGLEDAHLRDLLTPLVNEVDERNLADRWFFIRYRDPDPHLRVRWRGDPQILCRELLPLLHAHVEPLLAARRIHRLELGTYDREVERYGGGDAIGVSEEIFCADSEAALDLLQNVVDEKQRWGFALHGMDRTFADLGMSMAERLAFAERSRDGFYTELAVRDETKHALAKRFRAERAAIETHVHGDAFDDHARRAFDTRSANMRPLLARIRDLEARGTLTVSMFDYVWSILHMWNNRILHTRHRHHELVLVELLSRHYASLLARRRGPKSVVSAATSGVSASC